MQYDILLGDPSSGSQRRTTAHVRLYADGRALRQAARPSLARLAARTARRAAEPPRRRVFADERLGALVQVYPVDRDLRPLARVSSPKTLRRRLGLERRPRVDLVRYKPGRKALFRLRTAEAGELYAKVYAEGAARRVALARAVADAGAPTPRPAVFLAGLALAVQPAASGARLAELQGPEREDGIRAAVEALGHLHAVRPPSYVLVGDDLSAAASAARAVQALVPDASPACDRLLAALEPRLRASDDALVLLHGDFYDDQVLVDEDGATLLDLDEARRGRALVDVGTMAAHLTAAGDDAARQALLAAHGRSEGDVAPFEVAALLQLAVRPFRRLEPDWQAGVRHYLALAGERLSGSSPPVRRLGLELPSSAHVAARLQAVAGVDVEIASERVVRHKPGRRSTTRYVAHVRGRPTVLYAKAYASDRAPRVYENHRRLHAAREAIGAHVPAPLACDRARRLVVLSAVRGAPARPALAAGDVAVARRLAETLHRLHHSGVVLARTHELAAELAPLQARVARLTAAHAALREEASRCLALVRTLGAQAWPWRWLPILRDVYEDHVLVDGDRLALVDLDDAAMSEPAVDVANVVAHLRLLALRAPENAGALTSAIAVERRAVQLDPELDGRLLRFLVGTTLLRLAGIHGERESSPELPRALLRAGRRHLREAGAPAGRAAALSRR